MIIFQRNQRFFQRCFILSIIISIIIGFLNLPIHHQMERLLYDPKEYIINKHELNDLQCGICYDTSTTMVKCRGPCGKYFCIQCVSKTKNISDKCPNRCSEPFFATKLDDLKMQFRCPFSQLCLKRIESLQSFHKHHEVCSFTPQSIIDRKRFQSQYKCKKQHKLQFFIGNFKQMTSSICSQCQQQKLCRSICRKCDEMYCVQCRMPPCSKQCCPVGHNFEPFKDLNLQYICDVCGMNASIFNTKVYDDQSCNFGICQSCFAMLPDKKEDMKMNNQDQCLCGQLLGYKKQGKKQCSQCEKTKVCSKFCKKCQRSYCLKCKIINVYEDVCEFQHQFIEVYSVNQEKISCMRCQIQTNSFFQDKQCGIHLCPQCFPYFSSITLDKKRLKQIYCDYGHKLSSRISNNLQICNRCKKYKSTMLSCLQCTQDYPDYCFQCKPIQHDFCYFGHPLQPYDSSSKIIHCSICTKEGEKFKACKKCKFYACLNCAKINKSHQQIPLP